MLDEIGSDELTEWIAFYGMEPFGESWKQTGVIAATIGSFSGRMLDETAEPLTPERFMPRIVTDEDRDREMLKREVQEMRQHGRDQR